MRGCGCIRMSLDCRSRWPHRHRTRTVHSQVSSRLVDTYLPHTLVAACVPSCYLSSRTLPPSLAASHRGSPRAPAQQLLPSPCPAPCWPLQPHREHLPALPELSVLPSTRPSHSLVRTVRYQADKEGQWPTATATIWVTGGHSEPEPPWPAAVCGIVAEVQSGPSQSSILTAGLVLSSALTIRHLRRGSHEQKPKKVNFVRKNS